MNITDLLSYVNELTEFTTKEKLILEEGEGVVDNTQETEGTETEEDVPADQVPDEQVPADGTPAPEQPTPEQPAPEQPAPAPTQPDGGEVGNTQATPGGDNTETAPTPDPGNAGNTDQGNTEPGNTDTTEQKQTDQGNTDQNNTDQNNGGDVAPIDTSKLEALVTALNKLQELAGGKNLNEFLNEIQGAGAQPAAGGTTPAQ